MQKYLLCIWIAWIQIQLLLKLNSSKTSLDDFKISIQIQLLLKLNLLQKIILIDWRNSNTTLVKVKYVVQIEAGNKGTFKYNSC